MKKLIQNPPSYFRFYTLVVFVPELQSTIAEMSREGGLNMPPIQL